MQSSQQSSDVALNFNIVENEPTFCSIAITIPADYVDNLYQQAIEVQKKSIPAFGFHKRETPTAYIEQNYQSNLIEHIQEFLLKYLVIPFLHAEIVRLKILVAGKPRLIDMSVQTKEDAVYTFELSLFPMINFQEWKYLPFKAPKRKNYKDLDRQVESFLQDEITSKQNYSNSSIAIGDWIHYSLTILNNDNEPLLQTNPVHLWLKIGDEEPDKPFQELFIKKKNGDHFTSDHPILQDYFSEPLDAQYHFAVAILDIVPHAYFCLDQFKNHFRLKSNKELYQKFIEVFSYRNDLSQRRTMTEEALKLLFSKHRFEVPNHLILRQQKDVMDVIQLNPDYHVYRVQKDFKDTVKELAEKQVREQIFLDQLAYEENIETNHNDIKNYLNLTKRARTKEFLHFDAPLSKIRGQEYPILAQELHRVCLREKTLNHIIYHLTKK